MYLYDNLTCSFTCNTSGSYYVKVVGTNYYCPGKILNIKYK